MQNGGTTVVVTQPLFEEAKKKLFNFTEKLDIGLLDNIVNCMYTGSGDEQRCAQEILTSFKENPDAWTRVDTILEFSNNQHTKYYALQILEQVIKYRWKSLPRVQCEGIRTFIVTLIIKTSQNPAVYDPEKIYLNKLNMILVQILKREWPKNWSTFISEIVGSSKTNELLCQNNMVILKLLSEEVFDFSSGQLTQTKAKHLKDTMCSEFSQVFTLCQFVLENSNNVTLSSATLETLLRFLNWIPLGYIFETDLIGTLTLKYLPVPVFRNVTMKCLTEIAAVTVPHYDEKFILLFNNTMQQLSGVLPTTLNLKEAYAVGADRDQQFIQNLAMFLGTFLKEHGALMEKQPDKGSLQQGLGYLLSISEVDDVEIFKICFEYWNTLTSELYRESPWTPTNTATFIQSSRPTTTTPRRQFYASILSQVRATMISRMAKPEEVLVVENENGEVVREFMKDTDSINLYKNMRETLVYLTHLDCADTERIMTRKLQNQVNGTEWSWKNLNTLCWAIGSISGAMHEEDEKRFIVTVIKDLLGLCEQKKGKDNKAIIASNIMYVVGQYPRFLRAHWKFLKTVVNKLFEFMHETHDGVQDMACDTFIKISQKCRRHFVSTQIGEASPFIDEILSTISTIICDLSPQQVHTFYEAVGYMISAQTDTQAQTVLIHKYMHLPNQVWDDIILQAQRTGVAVFIHPEAIKQLCSILKTNVRACRALGHCYVAQLGRIYLDMMNVFKVTTQNINQAIQENGDLVIKQPLVKGMRVIKKETLKLVGGWITRSNDPQLVLTTFIPPLLESIILDYSASIPAVREPEALITLASAVNKLESQITDKVEAILAAVFESTLAMITRDFEEFPEHRTNFFLLLQAINNHCFAAFLSTKPEQFKLIYDSIIWGIQHTMRNVADTSLSILHQLLQNFVTSATTEQKQSFYQNYYLDVLKRIFGVLTDSSHSAGLSMHATILAYLFQIVENGILSFPLSAEQPSTHDNVLFVKEYVGNLLKSAFPHLTEMQLKLTVVGFFNLDMDLAAFKEHLRDFLVQTREFSGQDDTDLFFEEREAALRAAESEKRALQAQVPGILNPHEIAEEEMQD